MVDTTIILKTDSLANRHSDRQTRWKQYTHLRWAGNYNVVLCQSEWTLNGWQGINRDLITSYALHRCQYLYRDQTNYVAHSLNYIAIDMAILLEGQDQSYSSMMTSSNGNIFALMALLCREFTGHRWIPFTKASYLWSAPEQTVE